MSESALRLKLMQHLPGYSMPVENGTACPGTPDIWWCHLGLTCWVEVKAWPGGGIPRKLGLRAEQVLWARRLARLGSGAKAPPALLAGGLPGGELVVLDLHDAAERVHYSEGLSHSEWTTRALGVVSMNKQGSAWWDSLIRTLYL